MVLKKRRCDVVWFEDDLGQERWQCKNHLSSYGFKAEKEECWYFSCPGRMLRSEPVVEITAPKPKKKKASVKKKTKTQAPDTCDNYTCNEKRASNRKRYCSDKCRKQKARVDYEARNPNRKR